MVHGPKSTAFCFYKYNFIEILPHSLGFILSVPAFSLQWQIVIVQNKTIMVNYKSSNKSFDP